MHRVVVPQIIQDAQDEMPLDIGETILARAFSSIALLRQIESNGSSSISIQYE
jgi:hypothetical protein